MFVDVKTEIGKDISGRGNNEQIRKEYEIAHELNQTSVDGVQKGDGGEMCLELQITEL